MGSWLYLVTLSLIIQTVLKGTSALLVERARVLETDSPLVVRRGERVSLQDTFTINSTAAVNCRVHYVHKHGLSCGQVVPSVFDCGYRGTITFQHFGCLLGIELITFQLSSQPGKVVKSSNGTELTADVSSPINVQIFTLELLVNDSTQPFSNIQLARIHDPAYTVEMSRDHSEANSSTADQTSNLAFRLVFPRELVGKCYYEILNKFPKLSLPSYGDLFTEQMNQLLPCGFVQSHLHYRPKMTNTTIKDFVLLRLYTYHYNNISISYTMVPLGDSNNDSTNESSEAANNVTGLIRRNLSIRQVVYAPVTPDLFNLNSIMLFNSLGLSPKKYIVDVHRDMGSFHTVQSNIVNVTHTEFTSDDLRNGKVIFYPHYNAISQSPVVYRYSVIFDTAGMLVAQGEVAVTIQEHIIGAWPAQRTNKPLTVLEGDIAVVDYKTFDFYLLGLCVLEASMRLVTHPKHGHLLYLNGSVIEEDEPTLLVGAVRNGTVLAYKHSGDESFFDEIVWEVSCSDGPLLNVSMAILIAQVDDTPPTVSKTSNKTLYRNWHIPLSDLMFQIEDPDSPIEETLIIVHRLSGTLVRLNHDFEPDKSSLLFPFTKLHSDSTQNITEFYQSDLRKHLIWYIPPPGDSNVDDIEFTLLDSSGNRGIESHSVQIALSPLDVTEMLFVSTNLPYPPVLKEISTIRILDTHGVYITPTYLYTKVPSVMAVDLVYTVNSPIKHGHLCILSNKDCTTSITQFTQQDVNQQRIFYIPLQNFEQENMILTPTVYRIKSYVSRQVSLSIHMARNQTSNETSIKPFWVNDGTEKRIPARYFRKYSSHAKFKVTKGTEYGTLSYRNGTSHSLNYFTLRDLLDKRAWYSHDPAASSACSDSFTFDVILGNNIFSSSLQILIRHSKPDLEVTISPHQLFGQTRFVIGRRDFNVSSSFCPEFVKFNLISPPTLGVLSLTDVRNNLVLQLKAFSTFTAKDINSGLLHYSLRNSGPITSNISDTFSLNASNPLSQWPGKNEDRGGSGRFVVRFEPEPNVLHVLEINITSSRPVTWLPNRGIYGYILKQIDMYIYNSSLEPREVFIQADNGQPTYGNLNNLFFPVSDVYAGRVWYMLNSVSLDGPYENRFDLDIIVDPEDTQQFGLVAHHSLTFHWAVVQFDIRRVSVAEDVGQLNIVIRRKGTLWFESRVQLTTHSGSARSLANCSDPEPSGYDFCQVTREIVFQPNASLYYLSIPIIDNAVPERNETFTVELSLPVNAVLKPRQSSIEVTITDQSDYASVRFGCIIPPCQLKLTVNEGVGTLAIDLFRTGNLAARVGVICKTLSGVALEGFDFVGRNSTVWFEPHQTSTTCNITIIDDPLNESSERFSVILEEDIEVGMAKTIDGASEIRVTINADSNDEPEVFFSESEIVVHESETEDVYAQFTILRQGTDLSKNSVVDYTYVIKPGDNATPQEDFEIFKGDLNEHCLIDGVGCVEFSPGLPKKTVTFKIASDTILEGNETFHLEIKKPVKFAHAGFQSQLKVTILDGSEPAIIGFETTRLTVSEEGWGSINITRKGNIRGRSAVQCKFKGDTALGNHDHDPSFSGDQFDFRVLPVPVPIIFEPQETIQECPFGIVSDTIYEIEERFNVTLVTDGVGIVLPVNRSKAIITIVDPEDIPTVQFSTINIHVTEPLSSHTLDSTSVVLTLVRTGDVVSRPTAVHYILVDGTAIGSVDYDNRTAQGIVTFLYGETTKRVSIQIMANHAKNEDTYFSVNLSLIASGGDYHVPLTAIGDNKTAIVHIVNRAIRGPILPCLPKLVNIGMRILDPPMEDAFYDTPLRCITPCTPDYKTNEQYQGGCAQQGINTSHTVWEFSTDGKQFTTFNKSLVFANVHSQILEPIYLDPGMYVRCTSVPYSCEGIQGYPRTSNVVSLSKNQRNCSNGQGSEERQGTREITVTLNSYDAFAGSSEDLVELTISLPHYSNTVPVISTQTLTENELDALLVGVVPADPSSVDSTANKHFCSNLHSMYRSDSLLTKSLFDNEGYSLYSHLDYVDCEWKFSKWYPLSQLIEECSADVLSTKISVTVNVMYVQLTMEQNIQVVLEQPMTTSLQRNSSPSALLPSPIHFSALNNTNGGGSYVYPIAVQGNTNVFFYSVGEFESDPFSPSIGTYSLPYLSENQSLVLLHTDFVRKRQAWLMQVEGSRSVLKYDIALQSCGMYDNKKRTHFHLELQKVPQVDCDTCYVPVLDVLASVVQKLPNDRVEDRKNMTNSPPVFTIGDRLNVTLKLADHQRIQPDFSLLVTKVYLCERTASVNCSSGFNIWTNDDDGNSTTNPLHNVHFASDLAFNGVSFWFKTSSILPKSSPSHWKLSVTYALSNTGGSHILTQTSDLLLTFVQLPHINSTEVPAPVGTDPGYLYGSIVVFVIAVVIVTITCLVVGIMVCIWKVKMGLKDKMERFIASQTQDSINSKNLNHRRTGAASGRTRVSIGTLEKVKTIPTLRRTHSTIGFPATAEKYKRKPTTKLTAHAENPRTPTYPVTTSCTSTTPLHPPRSRSLPDLSYVTSQPIEVFFPETRRKNLNKVHTRVKMLNTQRGATSTRAQRNLKKAYRVDNLRTVGDITPKINNYGVNESKLNTEKLVDRRELVSYAVRSLAASAKTPEPESVPRTAL